MRWSGRRAAVIGVVMVGLVLSVAGCQRATEGARCRTTDWGDDGGAWILKCEKGRWRKALTKQQAALIILASMPTTTTTTAPPPPEPPMVAPAEPPTTTAAPPTTTTTTPAPVGSTRANPFPWNTSHSVGSGFEVWIHANSVVADNQQIVYPARKAPATGEAFVMVPHRVICRLATSTLCLDNVALVRLTLIDADNHEYIATLRPDIETPQIIYSSNPVAWERWYSFAVPSSLKDDLVLKASYTNTGTVSWFAIR